MCTRAVFPVILYRCDYDICLRYNFFITNLNHRQKGVHSHNDYWRDTPLYTALANGVQSIEADVWLNPKDGKLYVRI